MQRIFCLSAIVSLGLCFSGTANATPAFVQMIPEEGSCFFGWVSEEAIEPAALPDIVFVPAELGISLRTENDADQRVLQCKGEFDFDNPVIV
ncbi:MAG: hypothetical protein GWM87_04945, partial [Xanthomonadales bacterium]|nr:hypothetical protein [Xanthomonadales bacterium]NIX12349.1 hypothetical protein [Xanthomonadales bacterium]